ncbi:MAG: primosomal protein N' [Chlorobi bacterium]|nr:primosomal protein N' [Chlorobiota bacterium]
MKKYLDIILPVPVPKLFTYESGDFASLVEVGKRVVVSFGKKKLYSGVIVRIHNDKPDGYETKPVLSVLDDAPVVLPQQFRFWTWMAEYYMCTTGEVYKAALPSGLKLESESYIQINDDFEAEKPLGDKEGRIMDILSGRKKCTINELNNLSGLRNSLPVVKRLLDMGAISVNEKLREGYKPRTEKYLVLSSGIKNEDDLDVTLNKLSRAHKQAAVLMAVVSGAGGVEKALSGKQVLRADIMKRLNVSSAIVNELVKKGILEIRNVEVNRINYGTETLVSPKTLSSEQKRAYDEIIESFKSKNVTLLHGVTSSGKTELYIHLINEYLENGKQVLYLLPEIALTTQITTRLKRHFGDKLGIYHSKFSDAERVEVWNNLLSEKGYRIILGVRSSLFLPFRNLGLIIVDEEHETSYKQFDPAPRYHARDSAIMLAAMTGAKTLLGTGTPSYETYYNCEQKKYGLVELFERFTGIKMPRIVPVDTKEAYRKKQMKTHFHPVLLNEMKKALDNDMQVILFQNRRGFAPYIECRQCAWVPRCEYCDVSLTFHKHLNQLVCHYCGHSVFMPEACPACGSSEIHTKGFGTEKIEEEISRLFPDAPVARMDLDTTKSRRAYENLIADFEEKRIKILIGTQMITKGLDFDHVSVVGILNADNMLNYPDFRAYERSYQMMAQVSGRAGRKGDQGLVILQTSDPNHPVIIDVIRHDYLHNYKSQLEERLMFKYPPFYRLINVTVKHKDRHICDRGALMLGKILEKPLGDRVLGPQPPPVNRIQNLYLNKLMIKVEKKLNIKKVKEVLQKSVSAIKTTEDMRSVIFHIDVDPM